MNNNTYNSIKELRLAEIETEIKKAESEKSNAVVLMVISLFFLWPLLIFGAISYDKAKKKIEALNEEKKKIIYQDYFNENNQSSF